MWALRAWFVVRFWSTSGSSALVPRIVGRKGEGQDGDRGDDDMRNVKEARKRKGLVRKNGGTCIGEDLRRSCRFEVSALTP